MNAAQPQPIVIPESFADASADPMSGPFADPQPDPHVDPFAEPFAGFAAVTGAAADAGDDTVARDAAPGTGEPLDLPDPAALPQAAPARGGRGRRGANGRQTYHHGDLRRALVEAALRLVESGDEVSPTLRSVAEAVGVSAAAPYRHFADREALLAAVLAGGFDALAEAMNRERQSAGSPLESLAATCEAYVRFAADHPRLYRAMFGPECDKAAHPDLAAAGQRALAVLRDAVTACVVAGYVDALSAGKVVLAGWSMVHGLASLQADGLLDAAGGGKAAVRNAGEVVALLVAGAASTRRPMAAGMVPGMMAETPAVSVTPAPAVLTPSPACLMPATDGSAMPGASAPADSAG